MSALKSLPILIALSAIAIGVTLHIYTPTQAHHPASESKYTANHNYPSFYYPERAKKIIETLHTPPHLEPKHYGPFPLNSSRGYYGYKADDDYCKKRLDFFAYNTDAVFGTPNIFIPRKPEFHHRRVIPQVGNIVDPEIRDGRVKKDNDASFVRDMSTNITIFSPDYALYRRRLLGKQFSCLSQISCRIPGEQNLGIKNRVAELVTSYVKTYKDRPHCLNYEHYFPQTWVLYNKEDCLEFFGILNSQEYADKKKEQRIVYIKKLGNGPHKGAGVFPFNEEEETKLRNDYNNGSLCGKKNSNILMQSLIHNALLMNDVYKFDFRVYMFIASTDPFIGYYHDGYLRVSLIPYNSSSEEDEKKMILTNLMLNYDIYDEVKKGNLYKGMDEEALMRAQQGTAEDLANYLLKKGVVTDPNWADNYLRKEMRRAMIHIVKMSRDGLGIDSSLYQFFGIDFMLDTDLKLWFIEANNDPGFPKFIPSVDEVVSNMFKDQYRIVLGLLRSRMKRIINFVNKLSSEVNFEKDGSAVIPNLAVRKEEFRRINRNYFEEEYRPLENNTFYPFIDENLEGTDRYFGLISADCM